MSVDPVLGTWLKSEALFVNRSTASTVDWQGSDAVGEVVSPLALSADATVEADRQLEFLSDPRAVEIVEVAGLRSDLLGKAVLIDANGGGYEGGIPVFVLGVEEQSDVERTTLTVLRRLV